METFLIKAAQLILALAMLVIIHEFGHYIFARIFGIKVEKFYLFFNPYFSLFKWKPKPSKKKKLNKDGSERATWRDTEYGIGWVPLGGYVKIAGMIDESMDTEQMSKDPQPWEFRTKPAWQRLMVMVGGVLFNFILAIIIYIGIAWHWGSRTIPYEKAYAGMDFVPTAIEAGFRNGDIPLTADGEKIISSDPNNLMKIVQAKEVTVLREGKDTVTISIPDDFMLKLNEENGFMAMRVPVVVYNVLPGDAAEKAGLQRGDRLIAVDSVMTPSYNEFTAELKANAGKEINISVIRSNDTISVSAIPSEAGKLGFELMPPHEVYGYENIEYTLWEAIPQGVINGTTKLTSYVSSLKYVFTKEGAKSIGGFGAIGSLFPEKWNWRTFWEMAAFLSIILAFMNILPIPALDGGHVLFVLWEIVTRRKPSDKFLERAQIVGMLFLITLLLYANSNDIYRFFIK